MAAVEVTYKVESTAVKFRNFLVLSVENKESPSFMVVKWRSCGFCALRSFIVKCVFHISLNLEAKFNLSFRWRMVVPEGLARNLRWWVWFLGVNQSPEIPGFS